MKSSSFFFFSLLFLLVKYDFLNYIVHNFQHESWCLLTTMEFSFAFCFRFCFPVIIIVAAVIIITENVWDAWHSRMKKGYISYSLKTRFSCLFSSNWHFFIPLGIMCFQTQCNILLVFCMVFHRQTSAFCAYALGQLDAPQQWRGRLVFVKSTALRLYELPDW